MSGKEFFANRYRKLGWQLTNVRPKQAIRINETNAKGKNLLERLKNIGLELEKISFLKSGYWVKRSKVSAGATAEYLLGLYSIQEAAAQIPVTLFSTLTRKTVLDACAAPGGKTTQIADLMDNKGALVALDVDVNRLTALANQLERCRVRCCTAYNLDARKADTLGLRFDRALLDVPCSGNFATDPNWFGRRKIKDVEYNAEIQRQILAAVKKCIAPAGEIVYSTCSLEPEEDELNIDWAVKNLGLRIQNIDCFGTEGLTKVFGQSLDQSISRCRRIWPGDTQGFFVCKLKVTEETR